MKKQLNQQANEQEIVQAQSTESVPEEIRTNYMSKKEVSLDDELEKPRQEEKHYDGPIEEDTSITLMIFPNNYKKSPTHPDVVVMLPSETSKKWKQVGAGWIKNGKNGQFTVLKLNDLK